MIIDIHTHAFPDALAARALEVLTQNCDERPFTDGTCSGLRDSMAEAGIDIALIMPIATKPSQVRGINAWAAKIPEEHGNLISFGTIHPAQDDWEDEIRWLIDDGIVGVKLHPDYQEFFVDDPALFPLYRGLADAGLVAMMHAGVDIGLPEPVHCTPDRLARALDAVPEMTVIAAHMGGYDCWDDVERYLIGRDCYFDTSYSLNDLGPQRMTSMIHAHGINRIVFGTDSPWTDQSAEVNAFRALSLTSSEIAQAMGENALRLLKGSD